MEALSEAQGPGDCKALLEQLSQQFTTLTARLEDLEEHVSDLSTDVRLQARKALPPLSTAGSHDGSLHNSSGQHSPAIQSPRVAGPAVAVRVRSRHSSLVGASSGPAPGPAAASDTTPTAAAEPSAVASTPGLGILEGMKMWGESVLEDNSELKQALQLASAAAAAAADAQAGADRCHQQVLELRGRQGQAERRVDTLWQLQEGAANNQAAILQLQAQLEQQQAAQQQQQDNMAALRAQVLQSNISCAANVSTCAELRSSLQQLQQQLEQCCGDVSKQANQMLELTQQQQAATNKLRTDLQAAQQQLTQQLGARQAALDSCAAAAQAAQGKCEDLRQGAVVLAGRCDAITAAIKTAVDPLSAKMAELETRAASWSKAAALAKSAVQKEELVAGLAQLSTAGSRRDHERAQQAAGLASRLEALEQHTATKGEVVTLEDLQSKLAEVRASLAASLTQSSRELQGALRTKADEAATSKVTSSLAERLNSSETSLTLAVRSLREQTAVLIDSKADAVGLKRWQQEVADSLAELRSLVVAQAGGRGASRGGAAGAGGSPGQRASPRGAQVSPRQLVGMSYHGPARHSLPAATAQQQAAAAGSRRSPGKQRNTVAVAGCREYGHSLPAAAAALAGVLGSHCDLQDLHQAGAEPQGECDAVSGGAPSVSQCAAAAEAALAALSSLPAVEAVTAPEPAAAAAGVVGSAVMVEEAVVEAGEPVSDAQPGAAPAPALTTACEQERVSTEAAGKADDSAAAVISGGTIEELQASPAAEAASNTAASITPSSLNTDPVTAAPAAGSAQPTSEDAAPLAAAAAAPPPPPAVPAAAAPPPPAAAAAAPAPARGAAPTAMCRYASTKEAVTVSDKQAGRKSVHQRSQSQISSSTSAAQAGSLQHASQQSQQPAGATAAAAAGRPFSALQPWSAPASPPSTSAASLHSAATNAKLQLAGQHKEAARQQLAHKKLPAARGTGGAPAAAASPKQQHYNRSSSVSSLTVSSGRQVAGEGAAQLPWQLSERRHASSEGGRVAGKAEAIEVVGKTGGHSSLQDGVGVNLE